MAGCGLCGAGEAKTHTERTDRRFEGEREAKKWAKRKVLLRCGFRVGRTANHHDPSKIEANSREKAMKEGQK